MKKNNNVIYIRIIQILNMWLNNVIVSDEGASGCACRSFIAVGQSSLNILCAYIYKYISMYIHTHYFIFDYNFILSYWNDEQIKLNLNYLWKWNNKCNI